MSAVDQVRAFNRFYTRQIGVLQEGYLNSPYSLTQVRILYELAHGGGLTAAELGRDLALDAGNLSRILAGLARAGLVAKQPSPTDGRQSLLSLTEHGRQVFATLQDRTNDGIALMLARMSPARQDQVVTAMRTIESLLSDRPSPSVPYVLRPHRSGDMGWVVQRHGVLYAQEYGWDEHFEALVAQIVAKFIEHLDPKRERCWMAERDGQIAGSVFLVKHTRTVAKLRLLLVEPSARGLGIGARLVDECIAFAELAGYRKVVLWTNSVLTAARRIYERAGFRLVKSEPHHSFGHDLIGETWELAFTGRSSVTLER